MLDKELDKDVVIIYGVKVEGIAEPDSDSLSYDLYRVENTSSGIPHLKFEVSAPEPEHLGKVIAKEYKGVKQDITTYLILEKPPFLPDIMADKRPTGITEFFKIRNMSSQEKEMVIEGLRKALEGK